MTTEELNRCKAFLDYFDIDYAKEIITLDDGGNSCIMNPKTQWTEFLGVSINSVAQAVADELDRVTIYERERE